MAKRSQKSGSPGRDQLREILSHWKLFLYLLLFMTMMLFASHGTQDMYPTFLQRQWHFDPSRRATITAISGIGAIIGGIVLRPSLGQVGTPQSHRPAFILGAVLSFRSGRTHPI